MKDIIQILNSNWQIIFVDANDTILRETNATLLGKCDSLHKKIFIERNHASIVGTIIHEITHACIEECLLSKDNFTSEEVCQFFEHYGEFIVVQAINAAIQENLVDSKE